MKLAGVKKLKAVAPNKKKISQTAAVVGDTLVIDEFEKGAWKKRGCIDKKGKTMLMDREQDQEYHETSIVEAYCSYYGNGAYGKLGNPAEYMEQSYRKICETFLGITDETNYWNRDIRDRILSLSDSYRINKKETRERNRITKINDYMDTIPEIPDEVIREITQKYFPREYLIKHVRREEYYCTACACDHAGEKHWKDKKDVVCPGSHTVRVIKRKQNWTETLPVFFANAIGENIVMRDAIVKVEYTSYAPKAVKLLETIRCVYSKNDMGNGKAYYYQGNINGNHSDYRWDDKNNWGWKVKKEVLIPYGLGETPYDNPCARTFARKGIAVERWGMVLSGRYPQLEYLTDCPKLLEEILEECDPSKIVAGDKRNIWDALGLDKQQYLRLKQMNGGKNVLQWLQQEKLLNKSIPQETLEYFNKYRVTVDDYRFALNYGMSPAQIHHYIEKEIYPLGATKNYWRIYNFAQTWRDYLDMAAQLGHDPKKPIILRCKNLKKRHDECVEELNRIKAERDAAEKERFKSVCDKIHDKYIFDDGKHEFVFLMPEKYEDIEKEGRALHHCINSSNRYIERMIARESYLGFVRRRSEPDKPYYTIEFEPDGSIRQKRSEYNNQPNLSEISAFLRIWQKAIKKRLTAEDIALAEESREEMRKNLEQLRNTGQKRDQDFANLLESDYESNQEPEDGVIWQIAI